MQDLTQYSDQELSLVVFNTEYLYHLRHNESALFEVLDESFVYTDDQRAELIQDIEDEANENA